jgi:hypothetical protein
MRTALIGLSIVALTGLSAAPALACSAYEPCLSVSTFPVDGARDTARNVRVHVVYGQAPAHSFREDTAPPPDGIALRPVGGGAIDSSIAAIDVNPLSGDVVYEVRPEAALEANTSYEIVHAYDAADGGCGLVQASEPVVIGTFTTGGHVDTSPPSIAGEPSVTVSQRITIVEEDSCGPYDGCYWTVRVDEVKDDSEKVWLTVDRPWPRQPGNSVKAWNGSGEGWILADGDTELRLPAGEHTLRAIDSAGNQSAPLSFTVPACPPRTEGCTGDAGLPASWCEDDATDAGATPAGDGGVKPPVQPPETRPKSSDCLVLRARRRLRPRA